VCDDRACGNQRMRSDSIAAYDRAVGTNRCTVLDLGLAIFLFANDVGARIDHVCENRGWPHEYVIVQDHAVVEGYVVLDLAAVAHDRRLGHENILAEATADADAGARHQVAKVPHAAVLSNVRTLVDHRTCVNVGFFSLAHVHVSVRIATGVPPNAMDC